MTKIKPYVLITLIIIVINIIGSLSGMMVSWSNNQDNYNYDIGSNEAQTIEQGSISQNNTNWAVNIVGGVGTSFIPFASLIVTIFLPEPLNAIFSFFILVMSALQLFIVATVVLNLLPFENV